MFKWCCKLVFEIPFVKLCTWSLMIYSELHRTSLIEFSISCLMSSTFAFKCFIEDFKYLHYRTKTAIDAYIHQYENCASIREYLCSGRGDINFYCSSVKLSVVAPFFFEFFLPVTHYCFWIWLFKLVIYLIFLLLRY